MDVWEREAGKEGMKLSDGIWGVAHIQSLNGGGNFEFALKHHSRLDRKEEQEAAMAVCMSSMKYLPLEELVFRYFQNSSPGACFCYCKSGWK